ncbi:amidohydrolase [Demequina gelatinilytica]|uniref:amidohydrolase n=1 Tax=Demequina gelatinilytica TaxID=1638980 RepID=UPI000782384B|nr:amidohydrolase family protein [Demequina gelatinilytica]
MHDLILRHARVRGFDRPVDIAIDGGVITRVGAVERRAAEEIVLEGRAVVPGLWDGHVHFSQWARTRGRLDVSAAASVDHVSVLVREAEPTGMLVGFGFRWATWGETPTAEALDRARVAPTVLLSGDLHSSWVNTAAARALGCAPGLLREDEAFAVQVALGALPLPDAEVADAVRAAGARGVVGIVDLEMDDALETWGARIARGIDGLRVDAGFYAPLLDARVEAGAASGTAVAGTRGLLRHGPLKIITDGSLNTRTAHCIDPYPGGGHGTQNVPPAELADLMRTATRAGIACAIHAIGDHANDIALGAFEQSGARGSIEHAQLLADGDADRFAGLGVIASVQPEHALDDRDVADVLWEGRTHRAFPLRALIDAGATLALGSDAPVAPLDPWIAISAAVHRTRDGRPGWHPEQSITLDEAIAASTRSRVAPGNPADLAVLDAEPGTADAAALRALPVALTLMGGRVTHAAL